MMKSSFILETQELGRRLENRWIWKDLNLKVEAGSRIVLKGPTGSGKTLLLRVLAGLENPDHGQVFFFQFKFRFQFEEFNFKIKFDIKFVPVWQREKSVSFVIYLVMDM